MFATQFADEYLTTGDLALATEGGWFVHRGAEGSSESIPTSPSSVVSTLARAPKRLEDYVGFRFSEHDFVSALLAGKSGDVLHVWILTSAWTPTARKQLYAVQKKLIAQFPEEVFDFYLVKEREGLAPEDIVTGLPVVWQRGR